MGWTSARRFRNLFETSEVIARPPVGSRGQHLSTVKVRRGTKNYWGESPAGRNDPRA